MGLKVVVYPEMHNIDMRAIGTSTMHSLYGVRKGHFEFVTSFSEQDLSRL